jgi:hypothetical protein
MPTKLAITILLALTAIAHADEETALILDVTHITPRQGVHPGANGIGAELRFLDMDECMTASFGAFAAFGAHGTETRQDVLDVHLQIGVKPEKKGMFIPYLGLGLDVLHVTTHVAGPAMTYRGTTLGISAMGGLLGHVSDKLVYRATVGYLGAIVPGTGDDLGGVVLQLGLGYMIGD